jgi:hypothetical protein
MRKQPVIFTIKVAKGKEPDVIERLCTTLDVRKRATPPIKLPVPTIIINLSIV